MISIISPAKSLKLTEFPIDFPVTQPQFGDDAIQINQVLQKWSVKKIAQTMNLSQKLSQENFERYQNFGTIPNFKWKRPAVFMFHGDVYLGIDMETMPPEDYSFLQTHVRILSGMYGILRPFDLIEPYRLEMGTSIKVNRKPNLYKFWTDKVTSELNSLIEIESSQYLINLASQEYSQVIDFKKLKSKVIDIQFLELKDDKLVSMSFFAKRARGMMIRYISTNQIDNPKELKDFSENRYQFNSELSTENKFVFTRDYIPAN